MKTHLNRTRAAVLAALVVAMLVLGQNCGRFDSGSGSSSSQHASSVEQDPPPPVAFMSSEQIMKAMISATGTEGFGELTDPADDLIDQTYALRAGSLPSTNALDQATGPTLIAVTNIASTVCAKAVDRDRGTAEADRAQRLFFREIDFSKGLSSQSSEAVVLAFSRLARNAWRRDVTQGEADSALTFAREFSSGANQTAVAETRNLALGLCTVVLSSLDSLTY